MSKLQDGRVEKARLAIDGFQTAPSTVMEAKKQLLEMADVVREHLAADGAKIYVLRRHAKGSMVWRLCNTRAPDVEANRVRLSLTEGWSDWVIRKGKWLRIPRVLKPVEKTEQMAETEGGLPVRVVGRSGRQMNPKAGVNEDLEHCALLCPLRGPAQVAGALFVWREDETAPVLDAGLDLEVLMLFAPQVAAACQRLLQLEKAEEQLQELSRLGAALTEAGDLRTGYNAVAAGTGKLADATCSLLLRFDPPDSGAGHHQPKLFPSGVWAKYEPSTTKTFWAEPALNCSLDSTKWEGEVSSGVAARHADLAYRGLLLPSPDDRVGTPSLAVALFDARRAKEEPEFPLDELLRHHARSFLQAATVLLKSHVADLGTHLSETLSGPPTDRDGAIRAEPQGAESILLEAARLLQHATGADEALIYRGPTRHMRVRGSTSGNLAVRDLRIQRGSLTDEALQKRQARRVLDATENPGDLQRNGLVALTEALEWKEGVKSWLCCPVHLHQPVEATLGLVKLLTLPRGAYLGPDALQIAREVATHAAWEMYLAEKRSVLEALGKLSRSLSGKTGKELGDEMAAQLAKWAQESFLRDNVAVAIIARRQDGKSLVRAHALGPKAARRGPSLEALDEFSRQLETARPTDLTKDKGALHVWPRGAKGVEESLSEARSLSPFGIAASFAIPGAERLAGHLLVLDDLRFSPTEEEHVVEATRSMAVLLNAERERQEIKQTMGRFRHAMLGPIHGVVSSSLALNELSQQGSGDQQRLSKIRLQLLRDAEYLSLWRENERFYMRDPVDVKWRRQPLRPIVEHCFSRYQKIFAERGVAYALRWEPKGELDLDLDRDAIDLALSNLLDNAQKYCFRDREATLEVRSAGNRVHVIIEDIGHGIPEEEEQKILKWGQRSPNVKLDPFRVIPGEGMGLPMALAIIAAHRGQLRCSSQLLGTGSNPKTAPYRVRFTVELPFSYSRGFIE